jgi:hypothetical protein
MFLPVSFRITFTRCTTSQENNQQHSKVSSLDPPPIMEHTTQALLLSDVGVQLSSPDELWSKRKRERLARSQLSSTSPSWSTLDGAAGPCLRSTLLYNPGPSVQLPASPTTASCGTTTPRPNPEPVVTSPKLPYGMVETVLKMIEEDTGILAYDRRFAKTKTHGQGIWASKMVDEEIRAPPTTSGIVPAMSAYRPNISAQPVAYSPPNVQQILGYGAPRRSSPPETPRFTYVPKHLTLHHPRPRRMVPIASFEDIHRDIEETQPFCMARYVRR